jgi:hypothetical protein
MVSNFFRFFHRVYTCKATATEYVKRKNAASEKKHRGEPDVNNAGRINKLLKYRSCGRYGLISSVRVGNK